MPRPIAVRAIATAGVLSLLSVAKAPTRGAGEFTVASCQADRVNFSTTAFSDFATRGMTIRRACNPEGPGLRGLVTANATGRGACRADRSRWPRSPPRTGRASQHFAGRGPRAVATAATRCSYTPRARASSRCRSRTSAPTSTARRVHAQAAGYRSRTFNVAGATRIVQRVICEGGGGRRSCSARGTNYIRTYQAAVGIADDQPPTATIAADTPLATGAWVSNSQPLNYDAQDNVGVRACAGGRRGSGRGIRAAIVRVATSDGAYRDGRAVPERRGTITVKTAELLRGHAAAGRPGPGHRRQRRRVGAGHGARSTTRRRLAWPWESTVGMRGAIRTPSR